MSTSPQILTDEIKPHAVRISKLSNGGCSLSKRVITTHQNLAAFAEPCALALCEESFREWMAKYGKEPTND